MNKRIEILMIAPDESKKHGGGIASYANLLSKEINSISVKIKRVVSSKGNNSIHKLFILFGSLIKMIFLVIRPKQKIAHIHVGEQRSLIRKSIFIKLCKAFNIPVILHLHSHRIEHDFKHFSKKDQDKIRHIFQSSNRVILLSQHAKAFYLREIEQREPLVIHNGMIDLLVTDNLVSKRKKHILFLGELGERKGTYDLIRAFKKVLLQHPDAKLILGGDGNIEACKTLAERLKISKNIQFLGWISFQKKQVLLNSSKIFVLPSYHEAFPLSILEAMSCRLPIISTKVGGIPEEIEDEKSGLLIESGDIDALAHDIMRILDHNSLCDKLGKNARQAYLKHFSISKTLKEIEEVYAGLNVL